MAQVPSVWSGVGSAIYRSEDLREDLLPEEQLQSALALLVVEYPTGPMALAQGVVDILEAQVVRLNEEAPAPAV